MIALNIKNKIIIICEMDKTEIKKRAKNYFLI